MKVDLSVVVVSYNTRDLLRECLKSVSATLGGSQAPFCLSEPERTPACHSDPERSAGEESPRSASKRLPGKDEDILRFAQDGKACQDDIRLQFEVFVVDNASTDGSAQMVAAEFPGVHLIANGENRGFAAANNQALKQSSARYVLLLNPDTIVLPEALQRLIDFMEQDPRAGAAGVALLNPDGTPQHSSFHFPTLTMVFLEFFPLNHRLTDSRLNGRYPLSRYGGRPFEIDHPLGACFIVRRTAAEQVGWLDEDYFIYCEEVDWCWRLKRAGWKIFCVPQAKVVHYGAQSTRQFRGRMLVELHRSRQILFRKHYGRLYRYLARRIVGLGVAAEERRARAEEESGDIDRHELRRRLDTYEQIRQLN